jgi:hypothetical protein
MEKQSTPIKGIKKGGKRPGAGRPKGVPNKTTRELKDMILGALEGAGGMAYLQERANDPKTASAFLTLVGKVLPMTVQGPNPDGSHSVSFTVHGIAPARGS